MQEQFRDRLDDFIAAAHAAVSTLGTDTTFAPKSDLS